MTSVYWRGLQEIATTWTDETSKYLILNNIYQKDLEASFVIFVEKMCTVALGQSLGFLHRNNFCGKNSLKL